jgi:hypothetical protein
MYPLELSGVRKFGVLGYSLSASAIYVNPESILTQSAFSMTQPYSCMVINTVEFYGNHVGAKGERLQPTYAS